MVLFLEALLLRKARSESLALLNGGASGWISLLKVLLQMVCEVVHVAFVGLPQWS